MNPASMSEHTVVRGLARMAAERALKEMELHASVWGTSVYHFLAYEGQDDHDRLHVTYSDEGEWTYTLHLLPEHDSVEIHRDYAVKMIAHNKEARAAE